MIFIGLSDGLLPAIYPACLISLEKEPQSCCRIRLHSTRRVSFCFHPAYTEGNPICPEHFQSRDNDNPATGLVVLSEHLPVSDHPVLLRPGYRRGFAPRILKNVLAELFKI